MNKREVGSEEEALAVRFLEDRGCRILERNYRCSAGEIDIVFTDDQGRICFGEVKYRENADKGLPEEAVDTRKQRIICRVSDHYRAENGMDESLSYSFDVIAVTPAETRWIRNAFEYTGR